MIRSNVSSFAKHFSYGIVKLKLAADYFDTRNVQFTRIAVDPLNVSTSALGLFMISKNTEFP